MHAVWGTEGDQHANLILNLYISKEFSFQFQWNPMKCFSQSFSVKVDHSNNPQRSFKSEYILKLPEYQLLKWCMTNTSQEYSIFTFAFIVMSLFRSLVLRNVLDIHSIFPTQQFRISFLFQPKLSVETSSCGASQGTLLVC